MKTLLAAAIFASFLPSSASAEKGTTDHYSSTANLRMGQTKSFDKGKLQVTFLRVTGDESFWITGKEGDGEPKVILKVKAKNKKAKRVTLSMERPLPFVVVQAGKPTPQKPNAYIVSIKSLTPPPTPRASLPWTYRIRLSVEEDSWISIDPR